MRTSLRLATLIGGAATAVALSAGPALATTPATIEQPATTSVAQLTDPSDGYCLPEERGQLKLGADNQLYECDWSVEIGGYWWLPY
jgi:hypothetical protein